MHTIHFEGLKDVMALFERMTSELESSEYKMLATKELQSIHNILVSKYVKKPSTLSRKSRGLFNIGGTVMEYLYGTMSDSDRQAIEEHFKVTDENNHNLIVATNQQIILNDNFNKSINILKTAMEADRRKIMERLGAVDDMDRKIIKEDSAIILIFKLGLFKQQLQTVEMTIANAKRGVFLPEILTSEEIEKLKIDAEKLQGIRVGVGNWEEGKLHLVLKIPAETLFTTKSLIVPIPNHNQEQIEAAPEEVVTIKNETYTYAEEKSIFELERSRHCVVKGKCNSILNKRQTVLEFDSNKIILVNFKEGLLTSNCDKRTIKLDGHYFIHFANCSVNISGIIFSSKIYEFEQMFTIPLHESNLVTERILTFDDIVLNQEKNIQEIKELHYHKVASTTMGTISIIIIIFLTIIIFCLCKRQNNLKIRITEHHKTTVPAEQPTTSQGAFSDRKISSVRSLKAKYPERKNNP